MEAHLFNQSMLNDIFIDSSTEEEGTRVGPTWKTTGRVLVRLVFYLLIASPPTPPYKS